MSLLSPQSHAVDVNGGIYSILYHLQPGNVGVLDSGNFDHRFIVYSFEYFLGRQMFPIDIMPSAVQAVMKWLPFYYELFCPVAIFLGRLKGPDLVRALAIQTGWLLLAWAWANFMWKRGLGHYQAVGG